MIGAMFQPFHFENHKVTPMTDFFSELQHEFALPFTNPVLIFAILLLIVLLAPILLKRINVPSIIGLILAGVLIGPHGLNWIDNAHGGVEMFSSSVSSISCSLWDLNWI